MNTKTITPIHVCDLIAHETVSLLSVLDEDAVPPAQWMRDGLALYVAAHQLEEETARHLNWIDDEIQRIRQTAAGQELILLIGDEQLVRTAGLPMQIEAVRELLHTTAQLESVESRTALLELARTVTDLCGMEDALTANGDEAVHRMEQVWELFRGAVSAEHAERRQTLLEEADAVYGSRSLMALCPVPVKNARIIGSGARKDAEEVLALGREGKRIVVLASGDALYHGFGGTLAALRTPGDNLAYHPGITAFQALFCRLGLPWQDARLFCVHSGEGLPSRGIAEAPLSVTYAGSRYPAHAIARAVLGAHPASARRAAIIAERIGSDDERILSGTLGELADAACGPTSILVIFPAAHADCHVQEAAATTRGSASIQAPILALGLPEEAFERENNLITASDVRAVILSRLRLPAWGTLWDVGAGSGSVGLEAAALRPTLSIHGIERNPERCAMIERNRLSMGIANYTLHPGDALSVIRASCPESPAPSACGGILPDPDRVFIGGGGKDLPALLTACRDRLRPNGLIVVSAVTLESFGTLLSWAPDHRAGFCRIDIANERPLAKTSHHLTPQNTIYVFTFHNEAIS